MEVCLWVFESFVVLSLFVFDVILQSDSIWDQKRKANCDKQNMWL